MLDEDEEYNRDQVRSISNEDERRAAKVMDNISGQLSYNFDPSTGKPINAAAASIEGTETWELAEGSALPRQPPTRKTVFKEGAFGLGFMQDENGRFVVGRVYGQAEKLKVG